MSESDEQRLAGGFGGHGVEVVDLHDALDLAEEAVDEPEVPAGDAGDRGDGDALLGAACGTESPAASTTPSTSVSSQAPTGSSSPADPTSAVPQEPPSTAPTAAVQHLQLTVSGNIVTGDTGTVPVKLGQPVQLTVTSDVADEVHVHGADVGKDVEAGGTVVIDFVQNAPGRFEVELEKRKRTLTRLQVS